MIDWSEKQREVINSDDDRILVSASAGSGKTTVMIERVLRLLASGVKISNMLICTFTRASAADMRSKLYVKMSERGLKNQLKELSRADISTIDSFCQRIVTKYFYVLGIDPQFEMLDEGEASAMQAAAVEQAIKHSLNDEAFARLAEILRSGRRDYALKKAIRAIMNFSSINPETLPAYAYDESAVESTIKGYVEAQRQSLLNVIEDVFADLDEDVVKAELLSAMTNGDCKIVAGDIKENKAFMPVFKHLAGRVDDYHSLVEETRSLRKQGESEPFIRALIVAAEFAQRVYAEEKKKRSMLDFSDLENMTLDILKSDVADEIRAKYTHIFVDEYQDINPLQESLIQLLAKGNKLFMVGDLKQSIYAFRGCEPRIFKEKYDLFEADPSQGRLIKLDTNYRSAPEVISFCNDVFGKVMTSDFGGIDYAQNPMTAAKTTCGYVKMHIVSGKESNDVGGIYSVQNHCGGGLTKVEAEATLVAYRIQELLKKEHDGVPISFQDIVILTRGFSTLERLVVKKLREINVPVSLVEKAYFLTRPETGQLISYLRLIDNRLDDNAMALSMLSPLGGFNENELAEIKLASSGAFHACVIEAAKTNDKVKAFFDRLDRYYQLSLSVGADELVNTIVSECAYFNYAFKLGEDAAEVLDRFLEFVGGCPAKGSLSACLRFIDEHEPYTELSGDENSVKLMTIHKSKGREFRYVFVIGLGESFNFRDLTPQIFVSSAVAMPVYADHKANNSDLRFLSVLTQRKKQLEEELRILYVALTRAEYALELFATRSESDTHISAYELNPRAVDFSECTSALKWLAPKVFLAEKYDIADIVIEAAQPVKVLFGKSDEGVVKKLREYFDFVPQKNAPSKSYVSKLAHQEDENDEPAVYLTQEEDHSGEALQRGNAYHHAMELIDFSCPDLSLIPPSELALVDKDKLLCAASKMAQFKGELHKEKPFMIKLSALEAGVDGSGYVLVQGVIDLLVIDGDEATVIDYKTGKAHGAFEEGYFKQVNLYALAVERLLKKRVTKKLLYYFDSKKFVEVK
ncbi:MAG: UvrD-helicase domain-containing protein [Clostridia bacterium]|nr:UvrD-helicase domain-containing protein [Clostridia bacterium]